MIWRQFWIHLSEFVMLALLSSLGVAAEEGVDNQRLSSISDEDAIEHLRGSGLEKTWPAFVNDTSLIALAFGEQSFLPMPRGAHRNNIRLISVSPRVYVMDDFLSEEECDFLRASARYRLEPAMVVQNTDNWYNVATQTRNNEQVWLTPREERTVPLLRHVLKRIHRFARVPDDFAEALQIGRYNVSTKYEIHIDSDPAHKVARPATMITYLNDVEEGGDTLFPVSRKDCNAVWHKDPRTGEDVFGSKYCCQTPELDTPGTVRVTPKKGRSVLFFSHHPDGRVDRNSQHTGCAVTKGEKWIAQRWLRFEPYNRISYASEDSPGFDIRFDGLPTNAINGEKAETCPSGRFGDASCSGENQSLLVSATTRTLSNRKPRIYLEENFLSSEECDTLMRVAQPQLSKTCSALAGGDACGEIWLGLKDNDENDQAFFDMIEEKSRLIARFPNYSHPAELRIARLSEGGAEPLHIDSNPQANLVPATVLIFLNDVEEGGEIVFPNAEPQKLNCGNDLSLCCSESKLKIHPRKGDALVLFSHALEGRLDKASLHASCPVLKGQRWVAERQLWYSERPTARTTGDLSEWDAEPMARFKNMLGEPVKVFWVDPVDKAKETFMMDVMPDEIKELTTHVTHRFRARNAAGELKREVIVKRHGQNNFKITDQLSKDQEDEAPRHVDGGASKKGIKFSPDQL